MRLQHVVRRSIVLVAVLLLTLAGLPDGAGLAHGGAVQPTTGIDVRTYDQGTDEAVSAVVPGQQVLVLCDYDDLDGTYRIGVRDVPERSGEFPFILFVENADADVRVTDRSGTVAFSYVIPDWYPEFDRVRLYCVVFDQDGQDVTSLTSDQAVTWGTNLYLDVETDRALEDEPVDISYFGWVLPDETPLGVRVVANGEVVSEDSVTPDSDGDPIQGTVRLVPEDVVDVERQRILPIQLLSNPPGGDNTYWASWNLTVTTRPRFDRVDIRSIATDLAQAATTQSTYQVGERIQFEASAFDPDGGDVDLRWEFGDGDTANGALVTHAYGTAGTYSVRLVATDDEGTTAEVTRTVRVVNLRPDVTVVAPDTEAEFVVGREISFEVRAIDPDGGEVDLRWEFGDGDFAEGAIVSHAYEAEGPYTVRLVATDDEGTTTEVTFTVRVANLPPEVTVVDPDPDSEFVVDREIPFEVRAIDPDGGEVTVQWNFDDGTTATGPLVSHTFTEQGTYEVTVTVIGDEGAETVRSVPIRVLNRRPEVSLLAPDPGSEHLVKTPVTFDARGRDPDGGDVEFRWSFDDGTTEVGPRVTHSFSEAGTYTIVLDVTDEEQSTTQTTITVQVTDLDPTAEITLPTRDETYLVGREVEFEAQGSDPDGGDVEYRWDFDDGSTAFGPSATHTFGERGTYDVTLTITDDEGSTSEARLTVEVRPPGVVDIIVATVQSLSPTERVFIAGALLGVPGLVWGYLKRRRRRERAVADAE